MPTVATRPTLLDEKPAAEFLGLAPQTLANWRCTKRYPLPFIRIGRRVKYRLDHLEAFIASRTIGEVPAHD